SVSSQARRRASVQLDQRVLGGFLLRLFLAASLAFAQDFAADGDLGDERLCMIRAYFRNHAIDGRLTKKHLTDLLQPGLVILLPERFLLYIGREIALDQMTRDRKSTRLNSSHQII